MIYKRFNAIVARAFVRVEAKEALLRRELNASAANLSVPVAAAWIGCAIAMSAITSSRRKHKAPAARSPR
jgi:hypothetical protein